MKPREFVVSIIFLSVIAVVFFYKSVFLGRIPFPGDLLIAQYKPWRTYSYLGYAPGSYPQKNQYFDTLRQLYPWKTLSLKELSSGRIPLWNPHNFSGSPLLANNQSAVFYPLNILYGIFTQPVAWTIIMAAALFLASVGMYLFSRSLSVSPMGSSLAAVAYSYSLFMTTFLEYNSIHQTAMWLPFVLLSIELLLKKGISRLRAILFVVTVTSAALAGHLQIFVYILLFSLAYLILRARSLSTKIHHSLIFLFLVPLGISSIQLIPTFELIIHSARSAQEYQFLVENLLLQPYQLALFLGADLFGNPASGNYLLKDSYPGNAVYLGIVPLLFSFFALKNWRRSWTVRTFGFAALVLLVLMTRSFVSEIIYRIPLPFISTASPTNGIFLLSFCLSVLAALGSDTWRTKTEKRTKRIILATGVAFVLFWVAARVDPKLISVKNLIYSTLLYVASAALLIAGTFWAKAKNYAFIMLLAITILDSFYFFQKFNPFVPSQLVFPQASVFQWLAQNSPPDRFWGLGNANIEANFATQYGLYSPEGYDPLYPKAYGEFIGLAANGKLANSFSNATRSDAVIPANTTDTLTDPVKKKTLNLLGVRYILDRAENANTENIFPPNSYRLVYEKDGWKIFENLDALPRAFLTQSTLTYQTRVDFEEKFADSKFNPKEAVLLAEPTNLPPGEPKQAGTATISSYMNNRVEIITSAPATQMLVLTDTYFPGWTATVDGRKEKILKADWTFRAVSVPAGKHMVVFSYEPSSFSWGLKSSMMSVLIFIGFILTLKRKNAYD